MGYFTVKKIISGGQTGADLAALDFAIKYSLPHGGWISKGRKAEAKPLPDKYQLQEIPTASFAERTEKNILESEGTLIFSRGTPTGGTAYTLQMAKKHKRPCRHIDVHLGLSFDNASLIVSWIEAHKIEVLNIEGPRESEVPDIYEEVFRILEMAYKISSDEHDAPPSNLPKTVDEAVEKILSIITHRDSVVIANMDEDDLATLDLSLGMFIGIEFGIWSGNRELHYSCEALDDDPDLHPDFMPMVIIEELWYRLQETHRLRIVR
jgi:hypothetical protein